MDPERYRVVYGGESIGSYATAKEAWDAYRRHDNDFRPFFDPKKKFRYTIVDGDKEIPIHELGRRAESEVG